MARAVAGRRSDAAPLPEWIRPQLTLLVDAAPEGNQWLQEIKYDVYRMHARLDHGAVKLLTRTGLDWTHKYPAIAKAVGSLGTRQAYLDGELCGVGPDGITSFNIVQLASDGNAAALLFFLFDLLYLDDEDLRVRPLIDRKERLAALLANANLFLHYSDHQVGHGRTFHERACKSGLEGLVSKRADASYENETGRRGPAGQFRMRPAPVACDARSNACTARSSSWWAGPIPKARGLISAPCCSVIMIRADV
jgi:ATP-dependent DNA ligase